MAGFYALPEDSSSSARQPLQGRPGAPKQTSDQAHFLLVERGYSRYKYPYVSQIQLSSPTRSDPSSLKRKVYLVRQS